MIQRISGGALLLMAVFMTGTAARASDEEKIQQAVERGIEHLRGLQAGDGSWPAHFVGGTALAGLTLLECEVPTSDPAVKQAANFLRRAWTDVNDEYTTYAISLAILFFDRMGDPADQPIIQALGIRLLAGQNAAGGWTYVCPPLGAEDLRQLKTMIDRQVELKTKNELPKPASPSSQPDSKERGAGKPTLPKEFKQILGRLEQKGIPPAGRMEMILGGGGGDNSNTQFAILGLWAARRHGVPVEQALARAESRFRSSQNGDGGWGYTSGGGMRGFGGFGASTGSMTCAGLLGLAAGLGSAREASLRTVPSTKSQIPRTKFQESTKSPADPANDRVIQNGLNALASVIGRPLREGPRDSAVGLGDMYYLLWSVERVAVAYGLSTIGKKDWYAWGSDLLLAAQQGDGGWTGKYGSGVDTSFALLFLRRANLTRDLTAFLKGRGAMEVALRGGGVMDRKGDLAEEPTGEKPTRPGEMSNGQTSEAQPRERGTAGTKNKKVDKEIPAPSGSLSPSPPRSLSPSAAEAEAARLGAEFLKSSGTRQEELLVQLKRSKGSAYTSALAAAVDQLSGPLKAKAREALAERLSRMTAATLRDMLQDSRPEIRRAAALACAMKDDKNFIPELAKLLEDPHDSLVRATHSALKAMTGQDFGPAANASLEERSRAAAAWKEWWEKQNTRP